uniref:Uncharacterized protein n=1 Tax=Anguilla anguilla TaxID=7936 RepID=A0A0E9WYI3_ANGAN
MLELTKCFKICHQMTISSHCAIECSWRIDLLFLLSSLIFKMFNPAAQFIFILFYFFSLNQLKLMGNR